MSKNNSHGFSIAWVIVAAGVLAAVSIVGWRIFDSRDKQTENKSPTPTKQVEDAEKKPETWLTYSNKEAGLQFQYPESWKNTMDDTSFYEGRLAGLRGSIESPQRNTLTWNYMRLFGGGGICEANPGDQPFAIGNNCGTKQILSVEKIPSVVASDEAAFNAFGDNLFITKTKYMAPNSDGETTYQICLDSYDSQTVPKESVKIDDILTPCGFWKNGFGVKFEVENEAAFNSPEAAIAEKIMKSFNSY